MSEFELFQQTNQSPVTLELPNPVWQELRAALEDYYKRGPERPALLRAIVGLNSALHVANLSMYGLEKRS